MNKEMYGVPPGSILDGPEIVETDPAILQIHGLGTDQHRGGYVSVPCQMHAPRDQ